MRKRWKMSKKRSQRNFKRYSRPVIMNKTRPGLKRGGTRL